MTGQGMCRRFVVIGVALVAGGVTTLALITPVDNNVLQQTGFQHFTAAPVSANESTTYSLGREARLYRQAAALDVTLTFQFEVTSTKLPAFGSPIIVSTYGAGHGIYFELIRIGRVAELMSVVGGKTPVISSVTRFLMGYVPAQQWISVKAVVERSQSFHYYVDGLSAQSFTWNLPILNPGPARVNLNGTFGGSIRDLTMQVELYRVNPDRVPFLLIRLAQILAFMAIVTGIILLARRFLSTLIPTAHPRKPLVLVSFWTMGTGIAVNLLIDLLHFQTNGSNPYVGRNTWLLSQYPRFADFFQVYDLLRSFNPYGIQGGNYPPFGYWILAPFVWIGEYAALFTLIGLAVGFIAWWSYRCFAIGLPAYGRVLIVVVILFSLPVSFAIDRGNIDLLIFVMVIFGIAALERQRASLAATWIGLAAAAKIYPVAYLLIFLRGRRIRYLILGLAIATAVTILGFVALPNTFIQNWNGFKAAYVAAQTQVVGGENATWFNASIPGWLQGIGYAVGGHHGLQTVRLDIRPFIFPIEGAVGLILAAFLRWCEQSLWRAITLITCFFSLFSQLSNYYELLFLLIALSLFVKHGLVNRTNLVIAALFGLVLAPRAYFYLGNSMIDVSVLTSAPLLIGLAVAVLYDGHRERRAAKHALIETSFADQLPSLVRA